MINLNILCRICVVKRVLCGGWRGSSILNPFGLGSSSSELDWDSSSIGNSSTSGNITGSTSILLAISCVIIQRVPVMLSVNGHGSRLDMMFQVSWALFGDMTRTQTTASIQLPHDLCIPGPATFARFSLMIFMTIRVTIASLSQLENYNYCWYNDKPILRTKLLIIEINSASATILWRFSFSDQ